MVCKWIIHGGTQVPNELMRAHLDTEMAVVEHAHEVPSEGVRLCVHGFVPCPAHHLLCPQQVHCTWHNSLSILTGRPVTTVFAHLQEGPRNFFYFMQGTRQTSWLSYLAQPPPAAFQQSADDMQDLNVRHCETAHQGVFSGSSAPRPSACHMH